jgi:hypothetical protein
MAEKGGARTEVYEVSEQVSGLLYRKAKDLFQSDEYNRFTTFPAFMQGSARDWRSVLVEKGLVSSTSDSFDPNVIAVGYQKEAAKFGKRLYDLMRVAADGKEGTACDFCGSGVYSLGQDTTFAKIAHLDKIRPEGDPDLFWRNEYVMNCDSCGGHSNVDISAVTSKVAVEFMGMRTSAASGKIKEDWQLRDVIDATLEPFRHGTKDLATRIGAKFAE